jgi:hypothetical protein
MARQLTTDGYIDLGNATADALLAGVTSGMAAMWVYFDNTSIEQEIWDARISGAREFELTEFFDNPARNLRFSAVGTVAQATVITSNLSGSAWHSLMWGWNDAVGTNGTIYLFVDGVSAGTGTGYGTIGSGSYVSYQLGAVTAAANLQGRVAHYGLWTGVAPDVDLAAAFNAGFLPTQIRPDKLRQYLPLWGDGASEIDVAGGYTATPTGTTSKADGPKIYAARPVSIVPRPDGATAGELTATLADATLTSSAALAIRGETSTTAASATLAATGVLALQAQLGAQLADAVSSASSAVAIRGAASLTLDAATLAASGGDISPISGALSVTLQSATLNAVGEFVMVASPIETPSAITASARSASTLSATPVAATAAITADPV